ncbi:hypothetical protein BH10ACT10_BH10ACT10_29880 [soil metagenome]
MRRSFAALVLAALLLVTGSLHFVAPGPFESIVPDFLGSPAFWVAASGVAELACAAGLAHPRTRRLAGWSTAALFVVVFPANVQMAVDALHGHGNVWVAWLRLPLQVPLVLWAVYVARTSRRAILSRAGSRRGPRRRGSDPAGTGCGPGC